MLMKNMVMIWYRQINQLIDKTLMKMSVPNAEAMLMLVSLRDNLQINEIRIINLIETSAKTFSIAE